MRTVPFSKTYDGTTVLSVPELTFQSGKIYCIIGSNGSGKSTFAKILADVIPADQKRNLLSRTPVLHMSDISESSFAVSGHKTASIGYMPQKSYGFRMSTKDNILLGNSDTAKADRLMEALQITHLASRRADRLSGGETARMALARLMMKEFDLVILDEPTAAMDMETTFLSEKLIRDYVNQTNCTLLMVTHSLQQAKRLADEVLFFHKGQLIENGAKETVLHMPKQKETQAFLSFYGM